MQKQFDYVVWHGKVEQQMIRWTKLFEKAGTQKVTTKPKKILTMRQFIRPTWKSP